MQILPDPSFLTFLPTSGRRIYGYQSQGYAFSSNEGLLHALGGARFTQLLNQTIGEAMQTAGFSEKFIHEIAVPIMEFCFGQGADMNTFVGKW